MKSLKIILTQCLAAVIMLGFAELSMAQDEARGEAIQLYNQAQEMAGQNQLDQAITLYRDALSVARENELTDIVDLIEERLPRIYGTRASRAYQQYQSERSMEAINTAIEYFQESQEVAEEFGNDQVAQQARGAVPQLIYVRSVLHFRQENYEEALADLNRALELNPNYAVAQYQKAIVMKRMEPSDVEGWLAQFDRAIEIAQQTNNTQALNNARENAAEELVFRAVNLSEERQFSRAIELLNRARNYNESSHNIPYRLAEIANKRANWSDAESHARESLELHNGGVSDKAKIYFELGTALKGQGNFEAACSAFENARYGDFTEPANHELQFELKCEGHSASGR
ncbi:MAG: tetratricopeptide repeat protein [Balneolaceae bacterium]|nr:tetratricopeptide repeat protein [Balneolaceae bacterium]